MTRQIFVFGSNLAGIHGAGSAWAARVDHGAVDGIGVGLRGNSYAIPTKDEDIIVLPIYEIEIYVRQFIDFALDHPGWQFNVVAIGCGLAGYKPRQIAPMFKNAPDNCRLPPEFIHEIRKVN